MIITWLEVAVEQACCFAGGLSVVLAISKNELNGGTGGEIVMAGWEEQPTPQGWAADHRQIQAAFSRVGTWRNTDMTNIKLPL